MDAPFDPALQSPPPSLVIRADAFEAWLEDAKSGARIEYHRGHLVVDRCRGFGPLRETERREIERLADRALAFANESRLLLVQERHGKGDYSYVAIKPKRPTSSRRRGDG